MSGDPDSPEAVMDALDAAVKKFTAVNLERKGMVTGWVLMVSTSDIDREGDVWNIVDYATSPGSDGPRAVGIVKLATAKMDRDLADSD